ncbi:type I secretion system permease/ATPase [Novosphingobium colocasiae]|uniref:Type I secretion protein n=1 Tax=Novosphingobium colocasiae TaxID=1256513 RepID=A0A918PE46_9SPHN|nr:type I secretion system permease/ATPase [Novosphingobium colocasiae]GGZ01394.1 type I secretion protein [Novosphingobium colocasiae]
MGAGTARGAGGDAALAAMVARFRSALVMVGLLSAVLNFLLIGGSLYLMLVYDSVLPSRSLPTLAGLFAMVTAVYVFQGLFDRMRQHILSDIGASVDRQLSARVQDLMSAMALRGHRSGDGLSAMRDLDAVRAWLSSGGPAALIDLPWIIFFLAAVCLLHWILAAVALAGAAISIGLTFLNERATRQPMREVSQIQSGRNGLAESNLRHVEVLAALGMRRRMRERWEAVNATYLGANRRLAESISYYGGIGRVFRLFLQSALITVGALLVMSGQASGGVIFASSILCGRALAPVDQVIGGWRTFSAARDGWARLNALFVQVPETAPAGVDLPLPNRTLAVEQIHVAPPGTQRLTASGIDFKLAAGDALGIIGPSAAGKTTVARALAGVWKPLRGAIRLDGATLEQWDPERLGTALGYLPQTVELLEGTVGENIARFDPAASSEQIIAAARAAGMHDMIVALPQGYDTPAGTDGQALSAGQRQRIGLARALYGDPFLLVLDEPNSNLDAEGEAALEGAITGTRARGGIVIIIAHRPSALSRVSHVLFLRAGKQEAFGPRDEVLRAITRTSSAPAPIDIPPSPAAALG